MSKKIIYMMGMLLTFSSASFAVTLTCPDGKVLNSIHLNETKKNLTEFIEYYSTTFKLEMVYLPNSQSTFICRYVDGQKMVYTRTTALTGKCAFIGSSHGKEYCSPGGDNKCNVECN